MVFINWVWGQDLTGQQWSRLQVVQESRQLPLLASLQVRPHQPQGLDTNTLFRVLSSDFVQQSPSWPAPAPRGWKVLPKTGVETCRRHQSRSLQCQKILNAGILFRGAWRLPPLQAGDQLQVQDQHGYSPRQWSKTGVVDEAEGFDSLVSSVSSASNRLLHSRKPSPLILSCYSLHHLQSPHLALLGQIQQSLQPKQLLLKVPVLQCQSTLLLPQCQLSWSRDQEINKATHSRSHNSLYLRMVT